VTAAVDPVVVAARFATFGLAMLLFGAAAFDIYAQGATSRPRVRRFWVAAPVGLSLAALAYVAALAREASGEPGWPSLGLLFEIYAGTGFGLALAITQAATVALALSAVASRPARRSRLALSGTALAALAFVGHAADDTGLRGELRVLLLALHLLALAAWLGALPSLFRALATPSTEPVGLLKRFGDVGAVCVALVVATGIAMIAFMVVSARSGLGAGYVQVLGVKLVFVLGLLCIAAINRFRLTPMFGRDPEGGRIALRRTIILEQALGLGALASVALLGQLDPAM
jgi:putative copper resistance protein D